MDVGNLPPQAQTALDEVLGYLNFSSGAPDPRFQHNINLLFGSLEAPENRASRPWITLRRLLEERLSDVQGKPGPFEQDAQVAAVLPLAFDRVLPAYRQFHGDLLRHQSDAGLFQPFFLSKVFQTILKQHGPWDETDRIVEATVSQLNDFLGYRPVAVLNTPQKIEPYPHEWVCPIPLYLHGVGVAVGKYHDLIASALALLEKTPAEILDQAWFDPKLIDELSLDPRAYDFDHPATKRPNHHFGQWDPHLLDRQGQFRRFILQEVTLDAIWQRVEESADIPVEERLFEAAAVLAGTMLMASAIYGRGPDSHDSGTTLAKLLPRIAACRDAFYSQLLGSVTGPHGERLRTEAALLRQPFGGARQHLNQRLARLRATQLQHVHLAQLFARMGHPEASSRQAEIVPVASARMLCKINGRLTTGHRALDLGQLEQAADLLAQMEDLLHRAIQCGAMVDPWNILGFQGQFSLFPALENSVRDHRVDVLIHVVRQILGMYARAEGEAAAAGNAALQAQLSKQLGQFARWWDKFGTLGISGIESLSGREAAESAGHVASALGAWHEAGEASGDIAFWRQHVSRFNSPKAYALVVEALLAKDDLIAARALLMQWLSQHEQIPLAEGDYSFHALSLRWLAAASHDPVDAEASDRHGWSLARKFFEYLEANADEYWDVPRFEWEGSMSPGGKRRDSSDDEEDTENPFSAAYDEMSYRDSTADGNEGETIEGGGPAPTDFELEWEASRIGKRLDFLQTVARLWKLAAARTLALADLPERDETLLGWFTQAHANRQRLLKLLEAVRSYRLPPPKSTHEALVEYDRRRMIKESLLGRIIATCVETSRAARFAIAAVSGPASAPELPGWEQIAAEALRAMLLGDPASLRASFARLRPALEKQPVLYVPLAKNGDPCWIVAAQTMQRLLLTLLRGMPQLGLLSETCQLIATAQAMEKNRPTGEGVVTEFDRLFEVGYLASVECLVAAASDERISDAELIDGLQSMTESLLKRWIEHSRSLRLSVLEKVSEKDRWQALVDFVERYGHDLFTPRFLNLGNLRAILHQSVDAWLRKLEEESDADDEPLQLLKDLGGRLPRASAIEHLTLIIEAIVENYGEYKDFNSTTTQSDRGEHLHMLLDILRLKASYQRFSWSIKPVVMAHDVLVRRGKMAAAELWRRAVAQRTSEVADWHLRRLDELTRRFGMRLPTVADRLQERFVHQMAIDRLRALVRPAIEEARHGELPTAFNLLEQEIADFTDRPTGAGLDVPFWLSELEDEAELAVSADRQGEFTADEQLDIPHSRLSWEALQNQIKSWDTAA
jgi:hypothetical protein